MTLQKTLKEFEKYFKSGLKDEREIETYKKFLTKAIREAQEAVKKSAVVVCSDGCNSRCNHSVGFGDYEESIEQANEQPNKREY